MTYDITLSSKQLQAFNILSNEDKIELLYGGAAGGGKSVLGCVWQITRRLKYPKSHGLILRQTRKDIYSTVLITFAKMTDLLGASKSWSYVINEQKDEIQFSNGSVIFLRDAAFKPSDQNYDRLKLEVMDAWIEEGTQVDERAYIAIRPRIREIHGGKKSKLLITTNPGRGWVKRRFIKLDNGTPVELPPQKKIIRALVSDNPDKEFAENYAQSLSELDPVTRRMYLDGDWDVEINENPFFWAFNRTKHINHRIAKNKKHWILSFDFNKDPTTLTVAVRDMITNETKVIDHITANTFTIKGKSPLEATCELFNRKYIKTGECQKQLIIVTGDASGKQGSADRAEKQNFYYTIQKCLVITSSQLKVPNANMPHKLSWQLCNYAFNKLPENMLSFNHDVPALISEIESSFPDENMTLNEAKKKLGLHGVDSLRYMMHYLYSYDKYQKEIDHIIKKYLSLKK